MKILEKKSIKELEELIKSASEQISCQKVRKLIPEIEEAMNGTLNEFAMEEGDGLGFEIVDWSHDHLIAYGWVRAIDLPGTDMAEWSAAIDMAISEIYCPDFTLPDVDITISFKL